MTKQNKKAFTLAEVLITLGIIGVVAAMTLPTLIQKHQKQVYATSAKKAVNIAQNMFKNMQADEGVNEFSHIKLFVEGHKAGIGGDCSNCEDAYGNPSIAENIIPKYLKVVKTCADNNCNIKYQGYNNLNCQNDKCSLNLSYRVGTLTNSFNFIGLRGFYTADGMVFYFANTNNGGVFGDGADITVVIDTNGAKGPNVHGRDLFGMFFRSKDGKMIPCIDGGTYCILEHLIENGWKMDY